jgi:SOS-response transcriptional repressor LexA
MYPKYFEEDTVIVLRQPECESGQDCVVYVNGYDATLKKVIKQENGIWLQPLNPAMNLFSIRTTAAKPLKSSALWWKSPQNCVINPP